MKIVYSPTPSQTQFDRMWGEGIMKNYLYFLIQKLSYPELCTLNRYMFQISTDTASEVLLSLTWQVINFAITMQYLNLFSWKVCDKYHI